VSYQSKQTVLGLFMLGFFVGGFWIGLTVLNLPLMACTFMGAGLSMLPLYIFIRQE
jgi:hypothetical protein